MSTHDKAIRRRLPFSQRLRALAAATLWLLGSASAPADTVIVQDTFYYETAVPPAITTHPTNVFDRIQTP
jgi:hypothetical protein